MVKYPINGTVGLNLICHSLITSSEIKFYEMAYIKGSIRHSESSDSCISVYLWLIDLHLTSNSPLIPTTTAVMMHACVYVMYYYNVRNHQGINIYGNTNCQNNSIVGLPTSLKVRCCGFFTNPHYISFADEVY